MRSRNLICLISEMPNDQSTDSARLRHELDAFLRDVECRALRVAEISCGARDDALDVVQDAMFRFVGRYAGKPKAEWALLFWRVLDSKVMDFHRRRRVRSRWIGWLSPGPHAGLLQPLDTIKDEHEPGPLSRLGDADALIAIEKALRRLPARQRQVFILRVWHGLDVAQTAAVMQVSEGSVKTHLFRSLQQLRSQLEHHRE